MTKLIGYTLLFLAGIRVALAAPANAQADECYDADTCYQLTCQCYADVSSETSLPLTLT
jgi:hypothetical protein